MSREPRRRGARYLLAGLAALCQAACITVAIDTRVGADGAIDRTLVVRGETWQAIERAARRLGPRWAIDRSADGMVLTARAHAAPGESLPDNDAQASVTVRRGLLWDSYRYREDYSKVRLGTLPPPIAPVPPPRELLWPWLRILAHEKSLALIERRLREGVAVTVQVEMPGSIAGSNAMAHEGNRLSWQFNFRAPLAPRADSRLYHVRRVSALIVLAVAAIAAAAWGGSRRRRRAGPTRDNMSAP